MPQRPRIEQLIDELYKWGGNDLLANSGTGKGLAIYLGERDKMMDAAQNILGLKPESFATAIRARPLREYLRGVAKRLYSDPETSDFGTLWTFVLQNELREDQERPPIEGDPFSLR